MKMKQITQKLFNKAKLNKTSLLMFGKEVRNKYSMHSNQFEQNNSAPQQLNEQEHLPTLFSATPQSSVMNEQESFQTASFESTFFQPSALQATTTFEATVEPSTVNKPIQFDDTQLIFKNKSTDELKFSLNILFFCSYVPNFLLNSAEPILSTMDKFKVSSLPYWTIKHTFFKQFCAGENFMEAVRKVEKFNEEGVETCLDYSIEEVEDEKLWEANMMNKIDLIEHCSNLKGVTFIPIKITALGSPKLLEKITKLLYENNCFLNKNETQDEHFHFDITQFLEQQEIQQYHQLIERIVSIGNCGKKRGINILLDAEQVKRQLGIHYVALQATKLLNVNGEVCLYNTYQCYLKETNQILFNHLKYAANNNFKLGAKIVRGAYVESERLLAKEEGRSDPIHPDKPTTDRFYDEAIDVTFDYLKNNHAGIVVATHNENSVKKAVDKMMRLGIAKDHPHVRFGTLMGMCDNLCYGLTNQGFKSFKLLPFGPIKVVFPYLLRRLQENSSVLSGTQREIQLIRQELHRRIAQI